MRDNNGGAIRLPIPADNLQARKRAAAGMRLVHCAKSTGPVAMPL